MFYRTRLNLLYEKTDTSSLSLVAEAYSCFRGEDDVATDRNQSVSTGNSCRHSK